MSDPGQWHRLLLEALVDEHHRGLYLNNVVFHENIQRLAHSLPVWIEALAAQAEARETEQQAECLRFLSNTGPPSTTARSVHSERYTATSLCSHLGTSQ